MFSSALKFAQNSKFLFSHKKFSTSVKGSLYTWGDIMGSQGKAVPNYEPEKVNIENVTKVSMGPQHTAILDDKG